MGSGEWGVGSGEWGDRRDKGKESATYERNLVSKFKTQNSKLKTDYRPATLTPTQNSTRSGTPTGEIPAIARKF